MLCEDLDDFIHQILIADKNSKGPQFLRHQIFLCDPLAYTLLIHFGKDFFSEETKAAMILHLHKRYFGTRKQNKTKIFAPKVSYVKCSETAVLNNVLCKTFEIGFNYVRDVLVKEAMVKLLSYERN